MLNFPFVPLPNALRALRSRNYRLFFSGQGVSLMGNWMTTTAAMWLVYELSGSAFHVGLAGFATQIPLLVLAPFTGAGAEWIDRRRLLIGLQIGSCLQSAALAAFTLTGNMTVPVLIGLCFVQGFINSWEFPTRQALIADLVDDRADLPNAIALNSSMFNIARLTGPALAGVILIRWGAAGCFLIDAVSYLPVIALLSAMRLRPKQKRTIITKRLDDLREGIGYVLGEPGLRRPLLFVAIHALTGFTSSILAPVLASRSFAGDAQTLGHFYSAIGAGALLSAVFLSTRTHIDGLRPWVLRGAGLVAIGQIVVAFSPWLSLAYVGFAANGTGMVLVMAGCNTVIQSRVPDDKRGRVLGLFVMCQGLAPIGSILSGWLAELVGSRGTLLCTATVIAVAAIMFARRPATTATAAKSAAR